ARRRLRVEVSGAVGVVSSRSRDGSPDTLRITQTLLGGTMHKLTVLYPVGDGTTFDMEYYRTKHKEICFQSFDGLERIEIDEGLQGQPYHAIAHLYFPSLEAFQASMSNPKAGDAAADVSNFTNTTPTTQISTVVT